MGIKLNIKNLEIATAREQRTADTYDLFFSGWAHMPHDPDWYFGRWFTKAPPTSSPGIPTLASSS